MMPITLTFHESQYPSRVTAQLLAGLQARSLPGKFLYESPAQAQRWLAYHQAYSPSRTAGHLLALYQSAFQAAMKLLTGSSLHYISLGCGGGTKDVLCLQQANGRYATLCFTPMDVSAALVIETMLRLQHSLPKLASFPLVVDLEAQPELNVILHSQTPPHARRLIACFGMIPNFNYRTFLPYIRRLMQPTDLLLLSANLSPSPYPDACPHIVPQYDNPLSRAWFVGLLESLGFSLSDLDIHIQAQTLQPDGQVWQICTDVGFRQQAHLTLYDTGFDFYPNDRLRLFFSNRFTPSIMPQVLEQAGLNLIQTFLFDSQEEGIYLCTGSA